MNPLGAAGLLTPPELLNITFGMSTCVLEPLRCRAQSAFLQSPVFSFAMGF